MSNNKTTTSKIRSMLADAMESVKAGSLTSDDGRNMIGLANQISQSMAVEVKVLTMQMRLTGQSTKFGELTID